MSGKYVTGVEPLDKKRYKVFLDNEFAFVLYKGELRSLGIEVDREISTCNYDKIMHEILPKRAKLRAMNLLKSKSYTQKQLEEKLQAGFYPQSIIDEALEYVKSFHYVDDEMYARDYVTYQSSKRPMKRIVIDLQRKGISKDIINKVLAEQEDDEMQDAEALMIQDFLRKKHFDNSTATIEERRKICAALMRKGFAFESIRSILSLDIT